MNYKQKMKTHAASTSIDNYHSRIKGEHENSQDIIIFDAVKVLKCCTGRMIGRHINGSIENSSVVRSLNNLKKQNKITSPYKNNCPITGITVQWYTAIQEQGQIQMF